MFFFGDWMSNISRINEDVSRLEQTTLSKTIDPFPDWSVDSFSCDITSEYDPLCGAYLDGGVLCLNSFGNGEISFNYQFKELLEKRLIGLRLKSCLKE